ncbi:type IV pilus modification PilV family protein [Calidithermus terrae]|nr:type II secretion system protein [Calidithermus terrae]
MRRDGLTLIEVLVALVIIAVTTMLLGYFISGFTATSTSRSDTQAQVFARSYFEAVRSEWSTPLDFRNKPLPDPATLASLPSGFRVLNYSVTSVETVGTDEVLRDVRIEIRDPKGKVSVFETRVVKPPF